MKDLKYLAALKETPGAFNDIEFNAEGDIVTVENEDRVKQNAVKILMTEKGIMPYPNYGCSLSTIPGNTPFNDELLNQVSDEIVAAIQYLVYVEESTVPAEQIAEIKNLDVNFSEGQIVANLILLTQANTEVNVGLAV